MHHLWVSISGMQILMVETHIWFKFDYSKFLLQQQPADHWLLLIDSIYGLTEKHNKVRASNWWESIINFVILRLRYRVNGAHTELSYWPIWKMLNSKNCENRLIMKDQNGRHHTPERQKTENEGAEIFHTRTICCHSHFTLFWEEPDGIRAWLYDLTPHCSQCSLVLVIIAREERGWD